MQTIERRQRTLSTKEANELIEKGVDALEEVHNKRDELPEGTKDPERREALERAFVTMLMDQYIVTPTEENV